MYGDNEYGVSDYSLEPIANNEDIQKYKANLNQYVPPYVYTPYKQDFNEVQSLYDAQSLQVGKINYLTEDYIKQGFIDTATWSLDQWEEEYGLPTNHLLSFEDRREIIKAKKRGRGTTTREMLKNTAEAFSGGECDIIPHNEEYFFVIRFIGIKGIPRNMQALIDTIETIKPAHLGYRFEYTYNTYGDIKNNGWVYNSLRNYSHGNIRITDDIKKGMKS